MLSYLKETWAGQELFGAGVSDPRQYNNLVRMCLAIHEHPGSSFSSVCGRYLRKAGYILFNNPKTEILQGHYQQTSSRCSVHDFVLVAEDTTDINYSGHKATEGLGDLGGGDGKIAGLCMHTALALSNQGEPLGIVGQSIWAPVSKGRKAMFRKRPIQEKESYKWLRAIQWVSRMGLCATKVLLVADREGDFYEHFIEKRPPGCHLLTRVLHLHRNVLYQNKEIKINLLVKELPVMGSYSFALPQRKNRPQRNAQLNVSFAEVKISPPSLFKSKTKEKVSLYLIYVKEQGEMESGQEAVEWFLFTTMPINTFDEARQFIYYYTLRWMCENFHYTIKQGLMIECLQFDNVVRLENALQLYSLIGWKVLLLWFLGRAPTPQISKEILHPIAQEILEKHTKKPCYNMREALICIGMLAGFCPSSKQPLPGLKSIWQGIRKLEIMMEGYYLAKGSPEKGISLFATNLLTVIHYGTG